MNHDILQTSLFPVLQVPWQKGAYEMTRLWWKFWLHLVEFINECTQRWAQNHSRRIWNESLNFVKKQRCQSSALEFNLCVHRTHRQWCISVAGQPKIYRLCRSVWAVHQIKAKGLALCRPVSAAHLLIILCQRRHSAPICTNTTVQYSSPSPSLTGLSYGLTSAHQLYLCIQILDSSALWVSSKPVSQGRLM